MLLRAVDPDAAGVDMPLASHPAAARSRRLVRALALPLVLLAVPPRSASPGPRWSRWSPSQPPSPSRSTATASSGTPSTGAGSPSARAACAGAVELDPDAAVAFELRSSPGQRRAGLATLSFHLGQGAGSRRALDIGEEQAAELLRSLRPQLFESFLPDPLARFPADS